MTALYCIAWAAIAAATVWVIMTVRGSAVISRLQEEMRQEIAHWQVETTRARATAAQIARDSVTRAEAWQKGRDDAIAIMPLIATARSGGPPPHAAGEEPGSA